MQIRVKQIRGNQAPIFGFLFILTDSACLHLVSTYCMPGMMGAAVDTNKDRTSGWRRERGDTHAN